MPYVVLCSDPLGSPGHDPAFSADASAASAAGLSTLLIDHDALVSGDMRTALKRARPAEPGSAVYRGWMMRAEAYARLFEGLAARGVDLATPPDAYAACHHLPQAHASVGRWMPETSWVEAAAMDGPANLAAALAPFGDAPVTVKDWVKSQAAGYWDSACLIPQASDAEAVNRITARFRELQGTDLVGGLVFRRLVDLARAGSETREWRLFSLDGTVVGCWPRDGSPVDAPPDALVAEVAAALPSPFATADLARATDGRWWLMETGDGQVSGFPPGAAEPVISALAARLGSAPAPSS